MSEKLSLEFISPSKLNELTDGEQVPKTTFKFSGVEDGTLQLNVENWTITCDANGVSDSIANWFVDELKGEMSTGEAEGFKKLDYQFAVSMVGQLCDANKLISYLQSLEQVFDIARKGDSAGSDVGKENGEDCSKK